MKSTAMRNKILFDRKDLDLESVAYYESEYSKLKDLTTVTIQVSDFEGNKTKYHGLSVESLVCLIETLIRQGKN